MLITGNWPRGGSDHRKVRVGLDWVDKVKLYLYRLIFFFHEKGGLFYIKKYTILSKFWVKIGIFGQNHWVKNDFPEILVDYSM